MEEQIQLFDTENDTTDKQNLTAVKAQFIEAYKTNPDELFDGFDEIYIITFSSGIDFACKILSKFRYGEVIFGCERVIPDNLSAIMSVQATYLDKIVKNKSAITLSQRIDEDSLRFFLPKAQVSHEKIFCLKSDDGRYRVITGSANFSFTAFGGLQRENIEVKETKEAFDYYYNLFKTFRNKCTTEVPHYKISSLISSGKSAIEETEELPFAEELKDKKIILLEPSENNSDDDIEIINSVEEYQKELKKILPKSEKQGDKVVININDLLKVKRKINTIFEKKKETKKISPKLHIDYEKETIDFNGTQFNLNPTTVEVKNDIDCVIKFFAGYKSLSIEDGDYKNTQYQVYKFLNWYFASPFMPKLRCYGDELDHFYKPTNFPVFGALYGRANTGKSAVLRFLSKLMSGKSIPLLSSTEFKTDTINGLRILGEGLPIGFDDTPAATLNRILEPLLKQDYYGIKERRINYPSVVFASNSQSFKDFATKRAVLCKIDNVLDRQKAKKYEPVLQSIEAKATSALFSKYALEMFKEISKLEKEMAVNKENPDLYLPDILASSSKVLYNIFKKHLGNNMPDYIRLLTNDDYFGDIAIGDFAIKKIKEMYKVSPSSFETDYRNNSLKYTFTNKVEATNICDELPQVLCATVNDNARGINRTFILSMKLDKAKEIFGFQFKKNWVGQYI